MPHEIFEHTADRGLRVTAATLEAVFVEAAEAVRRVIEPAHVPFGDAKGYYAKVPEARDAVVVPWADRLAGRIGTDEALARMVRAATQASPGTTKRKALGPSASE